DRDNRYLDSFPTRLSSDLPSYHVISKPTGFNLPTTLLLSQKQLILLKPIASVKTAKLLKSATVIKKPALLFQVLAFIAFNAFFRSEEHTSELQSRENLVCR